MDTVIIDNTDGNRLDRTITWQFDQATNLCVLIDSLKAAHNVTTKDFWDDWLSTHTNIDYADDFGLALLGSVIGVGRPSYTKDGTVVSASTEMYRRIVKAQFALLCSSASVPDYLKYFDSIYGAGKVSVVDDDGAMTLRYYIHDVDDDSEEKLIFDQCQKSFLPYPAGVRENAVLSPIFGFDGQQKVASTDPEIGGLGNSGFLK